MTACGESVYNLIPSQQAVPPRLPRYKSCFPGKLDEKSLVYPMGVAKQPNSKRTFGRPDGIATEDPKHFKKAHSGHATLPPPAMPLQTRDARKGPTPKRTEKPKMNLHSGKNFITTNAVEAILSKPPKQEVEKPYTMKKTFGKVPKYLKGNKRMVALEKEQVAEFLQKHFPQVCSLQQAACAWPQPVSMQLCCKLGSCVCLMAPATQQCLHGYRRRTKRLRS
jgi:hypothetical protein